MVIGRPKNTSKGVTMGVAQLPVAHAHTQGKTEGIKWPSVTPGSQVTTVLLLRKKRGENRACAEHTSGQGHFQTGPLPVTWLTSLLVKKAPLWRYNATSGCACFRTRYVAGVTSGHVTDITSGHVTSGHVTSDSCTASLHRKCDFVRAHILLTWVLILIYACHISNNRDRCHMYNILVL